MKRRIGIGFALAAVLLAALFAVVGSEDVVTELSAADTTFLALGVLSGLLALTFRGLVWQHFLAVVDESMTRGRIAQLFLSAMFVKYVTPYGQVATEPFVAYLVARDANMEYEDGLAGILSADFLNYVPYYTFAFFAATWLLVVGAIGIGGDILTYLVAFLLVFVIVVILSFVIVRRPGAIYWVLIGVSERLHPPLTRFSSRLGERVRPEAVRDRLDGFYRSIELIATDRRGLLVSGCFAHVGMAFLMLPVYLGGLAIGHELPLTVVALAVALGKLGSFVPAPGGLGGVEASVTAALTILGSLSPAAAFSVAIIYRVSTYWLTIAVGGLGAISFTVGR